MMVNNCHKCGVSTGEAFEFYYGHEYNAGLPPLGTIRISGGFSWDLIGSASASICGVCQTWLVRQVWIDNNIRIAIIALSIVILVLGFFYSELRIISQEKLQIFDGYGFMPIERFITFGAYLLFTSLYTVYVIRLTLGVLHYRNTGDADTMAMPCIAIFCGVVFFWPAGEIIYDTAVRNYLNSYLYFVAISGHVTQRLSLPYTIFAFTTLFYGALVVFSGALIEESTLKLDKSAALAMFAWRLRRKELLANDEMAGNSVAWTPDEFAALQRYRDSERI